MPTWMRLLIHDHIRMFASDAIRVERFEFLNGSAQCALKDALEFNLHFQALRRVHGAAWRVEYIVDVVRGAYCREIGKSKPEDFDQGKCSFHFFAPEIDFSHVPGNNRSIHLRNVGLLRCVLLEGNDEKEIARVELVVQVESTGDVPLDSGCLTRSIFDPFSV